MRHILKTINISSLVLIAAVMLISSIPLASYANNVDGNQKSNTGDNCQLRIRDVGQRHDNRYDPLSRYDYIQPLTLRIRNIGSGNCAGRLTFDRGSNMPDLKRSVGEQLAYLLLDEHDINRVLFNPKSVASRSIRLNLRPGRSVLVKPRLYIARGQSAHSGRYSANIDAIFRQNRRNVSNRTSLHLDARVHASVQANFTGVDRGQGNSASFLRLGELEPGLRKTLGLQLRSNTDVDVTISSKNQGELTHSQIPDAIITYGLRVGGQDIDLSTAEEVVLPTSLHRNGRTSHIEVELENYTQAPAGKYADVLYVRVTAR